MNCPISYFYIPRRNAFLIKFMKWKKKRKKGKWKTSFLLLRFYSPLPLVVDGGNFCRLFIYDSYLYNFQLEHLDVWKMSFLAVFLSVFFFVISNKLFFTWITIFLLILLFLNPLVAFCFHLSCTYYILLYGMVLLLEDCVFSINNIM